MSCLVIHLSNSLSHTEPLIRGGDGQRRYILLYNSPPTTTLNKRSFVILQALKHASPSRYNVQLWYWFDLCNQPTTRSPSVRVVQSLVSVYTNVMCCIPFCLCCFGHFIVCPFFDFRLLFTSLVSSYFALPLVLMVCTPQWINYVIFQCTGIPPEKHQFEH